MIALKYLGAMKRPLVEVNRMSELALAVSLFLAAGLAAVPAGAAPGAFQCIVLEQLQARENGAATRPSNTWLIGKRFSINRVSGRHTGSEASNWS